MQEGRGGRLFRDSNSRRSFCIGWTQQILLL